MDQEQKFKPGDVVRLKSGGPKMTIVKFGTGYHHGTVDGYECTWFDDKNTVKTEVFQEALLEARGEVGPAGMFSGGQSRPGGPHSWMS